MNNKHIFYHGAVLDIRERLAFCFLSVKAGEEYAKAKEFYGDVHVGLFPRPPVIGDVFSWEVFETQSVIEFGELPEFAEEDIERAKQKGAALWTLFNDGR